MWSQPPAAEEPAVVIEPGSEATISLSCSSVSISLSVPTAITPTSAPSMARWRIASSGAGYRPGAIWVTPTVEVATISSASSGRSPSTMA